MERIGREGSSEYASAIKKGAPQAREVSDRWHLVKNLAGCVSVLLASCLTQLRRAEVGAAAGVEQVERPSGHLPSYKRTRAETPRQQARQPHPQTRFTKITPSLNHVPTTAPISSSSR